MVLTSRNFGSVRTNINLCNVSHIVLSLFISPHIAFGINEVCMKLYIDIVNSFFSLREEANYALKTTAGSTRVTF
jgi:hypothetical protein